jgi:hypothetical protein
MDRQKFLAARQEISFSQLLNEVDQSRVRDVVIQRPEIHGTFTWRHSLGGGRPDAAKAEASRPVVLRWSYRETGGGIAWHQRQRSGFGCVRLTPGYL